MGYVSLPFAVGAVLLLAALHHVLFHMPPQLLHAPRGDGEDYATGGGVGGASAKL